MGDFLKNWTEVRDATTSVTPWLAFRFLFAQGYNRHRPQGPQVHTKQNAANVAQELVTALGGSLMAPPPRSLDSDPNWTRFVDLTMNLGGPHQRSLMNVLVMDRWGPDSETPDRRMVEVMNRLSMLMMDMEVQQRANNSGWVHGVGWPHEGKGPTRKKRSRR